VLYRVIQKVLKTFRNLLLSSEVSYEHYVKDLDVVQSLQRKLEEIEKGIVAAVSTIDDGMLQKFWAELD
jgi:hypothetical protein